MATLAFELPERTRLHEASVMVAGRAVLAEAEQDGHRVTLTLAEPVVVNENEKIEVHITENL